MAERITIPLPDSARRVLDRLGSAGFHAVVVGGYLRDSLLGRPTGDLDIATAALPEEVMALFPAAVPTGRQFLCVRVREGGDWYEVTTFRREEGGADHRHPDRVLPAGSLSEDLARRDFTINAICYHPDHGVIDEVGGLIDLRSGVIRAVGDPERRFSEDALRILRAYRFAAALGFCLEEETRQAALKQLPLLRTLSRERVFSELRGILLSPRPDKLTPLLRAGGLGFLGMAEGGDLSALSGLPPEESTRWAALCAATGRSAGEMAGALRWPNELRREVSAILSCLTSLRGEMDRVAIKTLLGAHGEAAVLRAITLREVMDGASAALAHREMAGEILSSGEPYRAGMLVVSGRDLTALGLTGPEVGEALRFLTRMVIQNPAVNEKAALLSLLQQHRP